MPSFPKLLITKPVYSKKLLSLVKQSIIINESLETVRLFRVPPGKAFIPVCGCIHTDVTSSESENGTSHKNAACGCVVCVCVTRH